MPMNTFGFDCRAPRIMGDWMVGLPAERKYPGLPENAIPGPDAKPGDGSYDSRPQPYQEVKPDDPRYPMALAAAQARLAEYHDGVRYDYCEDVLSPDIFDPVRTAGRQRRTVHRRIASCSAAQPPLDPTRPGEYVQPPIGVPYHSHFFAYDPTDPPPPWSPRRPEWQSILVDRMIDLSPPAGRSTLTPEETHARKVLVDAINDADADTRAAGVCDDRDPVRTLAAESRGATSSLPSRRPAISPGPRGRPGWTRSTLPADAPVYMAAPGAMLYAHICVNCHGPNVDGKGLQADALAASSEGEARPANFREGLFGPSSRSGREPAVDLWRRRATVGHVALPWASRYMAWMALGGTLKRDSAGHHPPGRGDQGVRAAATQPPLPARRARGVGKHAEARRRPLRHHPARPAQHPLLRVRDVHRRRRARNSTRRSMPTTRPSSTRSRIATCGFTSARNTARPSSASTAYRASRATGKDRGHRGALLRRRLSGERAGLRSEQGDSDRDSPDQNIYPACFQPPSDPEAAAWVAGTVIKTKFNMPDCPPAFLVRDKSKVMWTRTVPDG